MVRSQESDGDPGRSRTCDLRFRKPSLYPSELQGQISNKIILSIFLFVDTRGQRPAVFALVYGASHSCVERKPAAKNAEILFLHHTGELACFHLNFAARDSALTAPQAVLYCELSSHFYSEY